MAEIGSIIDGKYEILREIGKGGMSVVYLAMDTHLNKQWAVKEIRKKGSGKNDEIVVNSLLAEANMMKRLDHPALPRIVDIIDNGVTIYVVMDYIEGESLDKILNEYGAQPEELVITWAKQLCDALSYLHSQKPPIIYRDMKPANIMLKPEGNIKIIDFGIAREYKEQNLADTTVLGTKGYAPPEQYSGQTDARSDIFALGMTMHHLLTGVDPRSGDAYAPVRMWNPELSEGIEIIIDKCVQPAAENRYQNCADLLYDLEHPELITRDYKKKQKRKLTAFITASALTVILGVSGLVCNVMATRVNNNNYETLVSPSVATSLEDKVSSYEQAIKIYPNRIEAYTCMLEAYEDEGKFGKKENDEFLALYNAHKDNFDVTSKEYAELNYKIGMMYFNYYTNDDTVLKDISFHVEPGQTIGIIGATGSGKSSLINLICRFYDVNQGRVLVDDIDVRNLNLQTLRGNIGIAMQDVFLFSDTIEGNIAYGNPDCTFEQVQAAAKIANADEFIREMPEGYDTIIGERGVGLSGGQKQRISLARAILKDPSIIILDDTTSAIDMETESMIQNELKKISDERTVFIIAHRISSIIHADQILVLDNGRLVERGTHEQLLAKKGYYSTVFHHQYGEFDRFKKVRAEKGRGEA